LASAEDTFCDRPSKARDIREDGLVSHSYLFMPPSCNGVKSSGGATPEFERTTYPSAQHAGSRVLRGPVSDIYIRIFIPSVPIGD
jgi:hypothetical protein